MLINVKAIACMLLCIVVAGCRQSQPLLSDSKDDSSPVIVELNGMPEHLAAFDRFIKARLSDFADQSTQSQSEIDEQRSRLLDEFICRQLILQEATKKNIEPSD